MSAASKLVYKTGAAVSQKVTQAPPNAAGRWPANVVHDGSPEVLSAFAVFGNTGGSPVKAGNHKYSAHTYAQDSCTKAMVGKGHPGFGDTGNASRFFYSAKARARDRAESDHPTVKPVDLMRWLVRMIIPAGGAVLDPFAGSGTTGEAAMLEGMHATLIERETEYADDIRHRIKRWSGADTPLFAA